MDTYSQQLDDVMEIIDTTILKKKLTEVEDDHKANPNLLNRVRLGIIYHETALNLSLLTKTSYKGYSQKSYDILTELINSEKTPEALRPYVASYRASALSLVSAETRKLKHLHEAFDLFEVTVAEYSSASYLPEFLRGSVSENLPWFFFGKKKFAKEDFQSIITKQAANPGYANPKIMSFTLWAWANQHKGKKDRKQALEYLRKSIALDPDYKAGRKLSEDLLMRLSK